MESNLAQAGYYAVLLLATGLLVVSCLGVSPRRLMALAVGCIIFAIGHMFVLRYPGGADFTIFHTAGTALLAGQDPYADPWMLSPPIALPLFALLALADRDTSFFLFTLFNFGLGILVALQALSIAGRDQLQPASHAEAALFTALFILSLPVLHGISGGQLSMLVTACLFATIQLRRRGWLSTAGALLGVAMLKPQTALPFALTFIRIRDWRILIVGALVPLALLLAFRAPGQIVQDVVAELRNIVAFSQEGAVNDYTYAAPYYQSIVGFNLLLYSFGIRDRSLIQVISLAVQGVLVLGFVVMVLRGRLSDAAMASLACIFSMLILYHRIYDAPILAVPIAWLYLIARRTSGRTRLLSGLGVLLLLPAWILNPKIIEMVLEKTSPLPLAGVIGKAVLIPYVTWSIFVAGIIILLVARAPRSEAEGTAP